MSEPLKKDTAKIPDHLLSDCTPKERYLIEQSFNHSLQNNEIIYKVEKVDSLTKGFKAQLDLIRIRHDEEDAATALYRKRLKFWVKVLGFGSPIITPFLVFLFERWMK